MSDTPTRAGFAAVIGAPNAGKSTLVNRLVGAKVSIVTQKVQTTRFPIKGVAIEGEAQIVLVDTPGIFKPKRRLDRAMVRAARDQAEGADAVVHLVDAHAEDSTKPGDKRSAEDAAMITESLQGGPKVILASSECMLNKQRRERPARAKAIKAGKRMVRERFGVDPDTCTGDHSCIRLSGCPSLSIKPNPDPLRLDPIAHVDNSCVGCGLCGEVSHAAVLCPSFYRAQIIDNPSWWDQLKQRLRGAVIGLFQRRAAVALATRGY